MRIVVTGALGHVGSRLIRELPLAFPGAEILMLDDLSAERYCSLFNLPAEGKYRFMETDILKADLVELFQGASVVVHLAAITNAAGSFAMAQQVEEVNFKGTERVAQACRETGCALVFLSTTSVYGTQNKTVDEACPITDLLPQSPYAESKLKAEQLLKDSGQLPFVTLRFGTIFGTSIGMRFHTAVNKFCWQAVTGQPLTVWRNAFDQKRPYLDLTDAIESIKFVIQSKLFDQRIYNVVTTNATVRNVIDVISTHIADLSVCFVDTRIMNQLSYCVSNELFKAQGFDFKGNLERGIAETIGLLNRIHQL